MKELLLQRRRSMLHDFLCLSQPIPNCTGDKVLSVEQPLGFVQATGQAKSRLGVGVHVASYISEEGALALKVALGILKELCLQNGGIIIMNFYVQ